MTKIKDLTFAPGKLIHYQSQTYWRNLSWRSYAKFLLAIFLIFSSVGFINDIMYGGKFSPWQLIVNVFVSGIIAITWVYSFTHNMKVLPVAIIFLLCNFFSSGLWPVHMSNDMQTRLNIDSIGILVLLISGFISLIQFIMTEGIQQVRLRTEMNLAKDLHDILVPVIKLKNAKYEVYGQAIPTDEVGGDLVDLDESKDGLTCYIADVSGHGVAAGLLMGMFKTSVNTYFQSNLSLAEILNNSNKVLHRLKKRSMFITCACIRFFGDHKAEYSIAGHLPILHFNVQEAKINRLSIKQIPITAKQDYEYVAKIVSINSGDVFMLLTDGLIEVVNSENEEFGIERIENLLVDNINLSLEEIFSKILAEISSYGPQKDDQTMLLIRCS